MTYAIRFLFPVLMFSAPAAALAAQPRSLLDFSDLVMSLADQIAGVLFVLAFAGFLWGVVLTVKGKMVGEKDAKSMVGKTIMTTGIIVLFVIASLWSILRLVSNTFFDSGGGGQLYGPSDTTPYPAGYFDAKTGYPVQ